MPPAVLDAAADSPYEIWQDYFSKRQPAPDVVRDLILELHNDRQHAHVIAAIEAALVNGQSQPWMYEVLALSMKIAGRPEAEIERALLSAVDFTGAGYQSVMFSAAYLARFDLFSSALRMYRQAAQLEPTRPEPYVLSLKFARRLGDAEMVRWAAAGVLTYDWSTGHQARHQQARDAVEEARLRLLSEGEVSDAEELEKAIASASQRDLKLHLKWNGTGDLDLLVEEPLGTVCTYETPHSPGGGTLVHDGYGPNQQNCFEEYVCAFGAPGLYRVKVHHVMGEIVGKRAQLTVTRCAGTPHESTQTFSVPVAARDTTVRIALPQGRRTELAKIDHLEAARRSPRVKRRGSLLQMLGGIDRTARQAGRRFQQSRASGVTPPAGQDVGYTPVITTLSEGITLGAQAIVSGDRRYVRLTLSPVFSTITDVFTFSAVTFGGGGQGGGVGGGGQPGAGQ